MAITSYATLVSSLSDWLNSNGYSGKADEFIQLAEAHFNREIRHPNMIATASSSLTAGDTQMALPTNFLAAKTVYLDADPDNVLKAMSYANLRAAYPYASGGTMAAYAIAGTVLYFAPAATANGIINLTYFQTIPALTSTNTTNWLLESHPDLYLRAARFYAYDYQRDDMAADRELMRVNAIIESIKLAGYKQGVPAGPLAMRSAVSE